MGKTPEKWIELTEGMKKGSDDLIAAAKAKDDKAVGEAAKRLNNSSPSATRFSGTTSNSPSCRLRLRIRC